jgi:MFS family permease
MDEQKGNDNLLMTSRKTDLRAALLIVLVLAPAMISVDFSLGSIALPTIQRSLGLAAASSHWIVTADALTLGGFLIVGGRLADRYGHRRTLLAGLLLLCVGASISGLSTGLVTLVPGRAIQGMGGALIYPSSLSLLSLSFPDGAVRYRAFVTKAIVSMMAVPTGALIGSKLITTFGWSAAFFLNIPIALSLFVVGLFVLPRGTGSNKAYLELPSAIMVTVGVGCLVWSLPRIIASVHQQDFAPLIGALVGMAIVALFVHRQFTSAQPLVPPRVLRDGPQMIWLLTAALLTTSNGALITLSNVTVQAKGGSAMDASLLLIPFGIMSAVGGVIAVGLAARIRTPQTVFAICLLAIVLMLGLVAAMINGPLYKPALLGALLVTAVAATIGNAVGSAETLRRAAPHDQGLVAAILLAAVQIINALGLSVMISLVGPDGQGARTAFSVAATIALAAFMLAITRKPTTAMTKNK